MREKRCNPRADSQDVLCYITPQECGCCNAPGGRNIINLSRACSCVAHTFVVVQALIPTVKRYRDMDFFLTPSSFRRSTTFLNLVVPLPFLSLIAPLPLTQSVASVLSNTIWNNSPSPDRTDTMPRACTTCPVHQEERS